MHAVGPARHRWWVRQIACPSADLAAWLQVEALGACPRLSAAGNTPCIPCRTVVRSGHAEWCCTHLVAARRCACRFKRVNMGQQMAQRMLRNNLHAATYTSETHMRAHVAHLQRSLHTLVSRAHRCAQLSSSRNHAEQPDGWQQGEQQQRLLRAALGILSSQRQGAKDTPTRCN